jgi:hypothetical protein
MVNIALPGRRGGYSARQREVVLRLVSIAPARRAALEPGFCTHINEI